MDMWTKLEYQTALSLAQKLRPATMFHESLRLQHTALSEAGAVTLTQGKTFQGDGAMPFRNILDALSSTELKQTKVILDSSLGWVLLFNGSNKGTGTLRESCFCSGMLMRRVRYGKGS